MSDKEMYYSNTGSPQQNNAYIERPRINALLKDATKYPLISVCAGMGYGKTRALFDFLQQYSENVAWIQLTEKDNTTAFFWKHYVSVISINWPEIGKRLAKHGFPDTEEMFMKYAAIRGETLLPSQWYFLIYDDFHVINNPIILRFIEWAAYSLPNNANIIILTRTTPDINLTGLILRERVITINEDDLCFSSDEISSYFKQIELPITRQGIRDIYEDTQGWAFAVNLIVRSFDKNMRYERHILDTIKANIFTFIETDCSPCFDTPFWRFLLCVSLLTHFAIDLVESMADDKALISQIHLINSYIRRDPHSGIYIIHKFFLSYLQQNHHILTKEEIISTYKIAGQWCEKGGYILDALSYFEKAEDYEAITRIIASLNVQIPQDIANYALEIFDRAPSDIPLKYPVFPGMHIRLKVNLGEFKEAESIAKAYVQMYEEQPGTPERNHALTLIYANWGFLQLHECTYTDIYNFDKHFQNMDKHFNDSPFTIIGDFDSLSLRAWVSFVGTSRADAPGEYVEAITRSTPYISHVLNGGFAGFDDLIEGEINYYRNNPDSAELCFYRSINKASIHKSYDAKKRALIYLMQIDLLRGDFKSASEKLHELRMFCDIIKCTVHSDVYDIANALYNLALLQLDNIAEWLKEDFTKYALPSHIDNYANQVKICYHYNKKNYKPLSIFVESVINRPTILFNKIELKVLESLLHYHNKQWSKAFVSLSDAFNLARANEFYLPFIRYGKDMRTLATAALRYDIHTVPQQWLEEISRKASSYAKRQNNMIYRYKAANNIESEITLTKRETEVFQELSIGMSRAEIAVSQGISINTVKLIIDRIYNKLSVRSLPEAIRIAIKLNILE